MPIIKISMLINAPLEVCFDLARNIDIHMESTSDTNEIAVKGRTSGLIELGESVTWEATHFGIRQQLTSIITEFDPPNRFVDEMVSGAFKSFRHEHIFELKDDGTLMTDVFDYTSPMGAIGMLVDILFLKSYMKQLLLKRNTYIKNYAEQL
ncbi:SRPBCC family protein [Bacillus sp. AFS017336]|uniref:SRPBCC family protein n=1 Tax=Bacillus sp. AFS017336 TaxID=2033489 RepID=UPI000BEFAA39|nr:SRPBCC family protein [Bacillus sp. AFS017336]PEL07650.1 cell division protein [Bacillus sp. AFS017336]